MWPLFLILGPRGTQSRAVAVAAIMACAAPAGAADEPRSFTVRATPAVTPELEAYLARVARPFETEIDSLEDLLELVRSRCGTVRETYLDILEKRNPGLDIFNIDSSHRVVLPACFRYEQNVAVTAGQRQTLGALANREMGSRTDSTIRAILNRNPLILDRNSSVRWLRRDPFDSRVFFESPAAVLRGLQQFDGGTAVVEADASQVLVSPRQEVLLPYKSDPVTYELDPDLAADVGEVIEELNRIAADDQPAAVEGPASAGSVASVPPLASRPQTAETLTHVTAVQARATSAEDAASRPPEPSTVTGTWPFDSGTVAGVLQRNDEIARADPLFDRERQVFVAVVDSGIAGYDSAAFPATSFWHNQRERFGIDGRDDDEPPNDIPDDIYGVTIPRHQGPPEAYRDYPFGDHGTHIAGLLLGGRTNIKNFAADRIKLVVVNIVNRVVTPNRETGTPETGFPVPPEGLTEALSYVRRYTPASIVNISFTSQAAILAFEDVLRHAEELLLVISAGNDGKSLDDFRLYPPAYGGNASDFRRQVITVAAHDGMFRLPRFSNYSSNLVDLAAPGCDIVSYSFDEEFMSYDGTSFAAPLVTLTAALLRSEGLRKPAEIKQRLLASVDVRPELQGKVASEGTLNMVKALSVHDDVIEVGGGRRELLFGRLTAPQSFDVCMHTNPVPLDNIVKIVPNYTSAFGPATRFSLFNDGQLEHVICPLVDVEIEFAVNGEIIPRRMALLDLSDIVPAVFRREA